MAKQEKTSKSVDFEKALARLEEIIGEMEGGDLNLDKMIAHFEEGSKLVKQCGDKLLDVEKRIEALVKKNDALATEPLDAETLEEDSDETSGNDQGEIPF